MFSLYVSRAKAILSTPVEYPHRPLSPYNISQHEGHTQASEEQNR